MGMSETAVNAQQQRRNDDAPVRAVRPHGVSGVPHRWSRTVAVDCVAMQDVVAIVAGAFLPVAIYAVFGGVAVDYALTIQSSLLASIVVVMLLRSWGMYDTNKIHDLPEHPDRLFAALAAAFCAVVGLGIPQAIEHAHLWVWYATWGCASYTLLLLNRAVSRSVLKRMTAAGLFDQRIAVFGAGKVARRVHDQLSDPSLGVRFVGVYDDRVDCERVDTEGLCIAGGLDDLIAAGRESAVDRIIIALPQVADGRIAMITGKLERLAVSVHVVTHLASDLVDVDCHHKVSNIGDVGLLDVKAKALSDWAPIVKRWEDIVFGSLALAIVSLIAPFIALAIKLESPGPVLFRQRRRGLNMKEFEVLKFRTMTCMENGEDVRQAERNDPRVTRVGAFLRRFSLDELPQLVNVIKGEMSLVGPRPHAIAHDDEFSSAIERYANRHQVKPGITGLAQVNGYRGETRTMGHLEKRVQFDIEYIKNWSFLLDLKILARTGLAVIFGTNAY